MRPGLAPSSACDSLVVDLPEKLKTNKTAGSKCYGLNAGIALYGTMGERSSALRRDWELKFKYCIKSSKFQALFTFPSTESSQPANNGYGSTLKFSVTA